MDKLRRIARRVETMFPLIANAWGFDIDNENQFPNRSFNEELEDAAEGGVELQPKKVLRDRQYLNQPLIVLPEYKGDFLQKLVQDFKNKAADDQDNLWDFDNPSELLKHQEAPIPREVLDDYYEDMRPGPGPGGGSETLKDYWDRGWDREDSPEMSEDKYLRKLLFPHGAPYRNAMVRNVIARHFCDCCPIDLHIPVGEGTRLAMLLSDLEKSLIFTKANKLRKPDPSGVSVRLVNSESKPWIYHWVFHTSSGKETYTTVFQFIPESGMKDLKKLHVRVSCSCPSWLFWGAQYNAFRNDYLEGPIVPKLTPPKKRDPTGRFLVCKHVMACIPLISKFIPRYITKGIPPSRLKNIEEERSKFMKKIKGPADIRVRLPEKPEKLRIPKELAPLEERPDISEAVKKWDMMSDMRRKRFVMNLEDPDAVAFMAHRFPESATGYVAQKLRDMTHKEKTLSERKKAEELLREII